MQIIYAFDFHASSLHQAMGKLLCQQVTIANAILRVNRLFSYGLGDQLARIILSAFSFQDWKLFFYWKNTVFVDQSFA